MSLIFKHTCGNRNKRTATISTYQNTTLKWIAKPYGSNLEKCILIERKQQFEIYHFACFCQKKKIIMEWDKQWKLHCNADRFIDNLVWDNQLRVYMILYNQFEGEGYKVCCNLSYTQTWHIFFLLFFFKTSIINISKLTKSWNYKPGSDISISLNHLATKYLWKTIMNFSNAGGKLKIETG